MKQQARSPQGWSCLFRRHQTCSTQIIWMPWLFNATTIIRTWFLFLRKTIWRNGMRREGVQKGIRRRGRVCESNLGERWSGRSGRRGRGRGRRRNFGGGWPGHGGRPRPARGGARRQWVGSSPAARSSPRSCTATSAPRPSPASTPDPPSLLPFPPPETKMDPSTGRLLTPYGGERDRALSYGERECQLSMWKNRWGFTDHHHTTEGAPWGTSKRGRRNSRRSPPPCAERRRVRVWIPPPTWIDVAFRVDLDCDLWS